MSAQEPVAVITSDGSTVRVDRGHRGMGPDAMDAATAYAVKVGEHLWVATTCHRLSVEALVELVRERLRPEPQIGTLQDALMLLAAGTPLCTCGHRQGMHNHNGDHCGGNHPEACGCPGFEATP